MLMCFRDGAEVDLKLPQVEKKPVGTLRFAQPPFSPRRAISRIR
jgi:hypothetical protein